MLLTNLREETRPLAPRLAGLLLRMYVLAIPFVTVWLTVFTRRDDVGGVVDSSSIGGLLIDRVLFASRGRGLKRARARRSF